MRLCALKLFLTFLRPGCLWWGGLLFLCCGSVGVGHQLFGAGLSCATAAVSWHPNGASWFQFWAVGLFIVPQLLHYCGSLLCPRRVSGWSWCQTSCSYKFIFSLNKIKKIPDIPDCRAPWLRLPLFINCNSSVSSPPSNLSVSQNIWTARGGRCTPTSWRVSTGCGSRGLRAPTPSWPMRWVWARRCRPPSSFTRCIKRWVAVRSWILLYPCGAAHAEAVTVYLLLWLESFGSSSSPPFCWKFELLLELDLNSFTYVIFISFFLLNLVWDELMKWIFRSVLQLSGALCGYVMSVGGCHPIG